MRDARAGPPVRHEAPGAARDRVGGRAQMTGETRENRLKRLRIRSWRRGVKEMDLVLGNYANDMLDSLPDGELDLFEALLEEMDQDLLRWITGQEPEPGHYTELFARLKKHAASRGFAR